MIGQLWKPNKALGTKLLLNVLEKCEVRIKESITKSKKHRWVVLSSHSVVSYVVSLKGAEEFLLDLGALINTGIQGKENI